MFKFIRNLLGARSADPLVKAERDFGPHDANPVAVATIMGGAEGGLKATAGAWECEQFEPEYKTFWEKFYVRPDKRLADVIGEEGLTGLQSWLHWSSREAEPKAFVRLMLQLMGEGREIWNQPGISLFLDGRWSDGGGPSAASDEGLALLARTLDKPIKLYFGRTPGEPPQVNRYGC